jgi:hypothetical protein
MPPLDGRAVVTVIVAWPSLDDSKGYIMGAFK